MTADVDRNLDNQGDVSMAKSLHKIILRCVVATLALTPFQLWAQSADTESKLILDEIIVTAQRREESLQSVPLSVTAVTGEMLSKGGVFDVTRLKLLTPGLNYGQTGTSAHLAIRGARTEGILVNVQPIISFYSDGIYRSGTSQMSAPMIDVERIEVLRGPQGTLFGRNSYGGAINVLSKWPEQEFDLGVAVTAGDYSRQDYQGFVNFALSDTVSARLVASHREHDGYVENTFNRSEDIKDQDDTYFRGLLLFEPNDRVSLLVRGEYWEQGGNGSADFNYFSPGSPENSDAAGQALPLNVLGGTVDGTQNEDPYRFARDVDFILDAEQKTFSAHLNWQFDVANMMLMVAHTEYENFHTNDIDMGPVDTGFEGQWDVLETDQVEVHFSDNGEGSLQWLLGAFYLKEENRDSFFIEANGVGVDGFAFNFANKRNIEIDAWAAFGQVTIPVMEDRLRLTVGFRYSDEEQKQKLVEFFECCAGGTFLPPLLTTVADFRNTGFDPDVDPLAQARADCLADLINCGFDTFFAHADLSETYDPITWHLAIDYDLTENSLLYASVSTGYSTGGFNQSENPITGQFIFEEQNATAFEIGSKNTLLDGAMTLNVALFYNDFEEMLAEPNAFVGAANIIYNEVGGDGDALGVDFELDWIPTENMLINIRAEWLDAEYGTFNTGVGGKLTTGNITRPEFNTGAPLPFVDVSGRRIAFSPEFTLGISAEYGFDLGQSGSLTPAIQFYYSSDYQTADQYFPFALQDSYTQTDLRLTWLSPQGRWTISGFIQNLEDEEVILRTNIFTGEQIGQTFADPSIYGVTVGYRYR